MHGVRHPDHGRRGRSLRVHEPGGYGEPDGRGQGGHSGAERERLGGGTGSLYGTDFRGDGGRQSPAGQAGDAVRNGGARQAAEPGVPGDRGGAGADDDLRVYHDDGGCVRTAAGDRPAEGAGRLRRQYPGGVPGRGRVPGPAGRIAGRPAGLCVCPGGERERVRFLHHLPAAAAARGGDRIHRGGGPQLPAADQARGGH